MYNIDYINIFEGSYTDGGALAQLVYRGSYKCAGDFVLRRDLTQLVKSEARVIDDNKSIQPFDIIEFWFQDLRRFGRVVDVIPCVLFAGHRQFINNWKKQCPSF